jgi:hypothetical protein
MLTVTGRVFAGLAAAIVLAAPPTAAQAPPPPAQAAAPKPAPSPAPPAPAPRQDASAVDPRLAGVPIYPGASFLQSIELDKGQWLFVFGTNDLYANVVTFYKNQLGKSPTEVTRTPAIQQFDLGSFDSGRMSQRPSVLVKDFTMPDADGYLHVSGTTRMRYKTLIQIIPVTK